MKLFINEDLDFSGQALEQMKYWLRNHTKTFPCMTPQWTWARMREIRHIDQKTRVMR